MTTFSKILAAEVAARNGQTANQQTQQQSPQVQQPIPAPAKSTVELYSPYRTVNS